MTRITGADEFDQEYSVEVEFTSWMNDSLGNCYRVYCDGRLQVIVLDESMGVAHIRNACRTSYVMRVCKWKIEKAFIEGIGA